MKAERCPWALRVMDNVATAFPPIRLTNKELAGCRRRGKKYEASAEFLRKVHTDGGQRVARVQVGDG